MAFNFKNFLKKFLYSFLSNLISLAIRVIYILVLPKIISLENFGYWQLYYLYASFIHFCHLGLVDGVYLKYGGILFEDLNYNKLKPQTWILFFCGLAWSALIVVGGIFLIDDFNKFYLLCIICFDIILTLPKTLFSIVFQATGKIKEYSYSLFSESIVTFVMVSFFLFYGVRDFKIIVLADLIARAFSLIISMNFGKELVGFIKVSILDVLESIDNIRVGINILIANMSGMLMLAIVRLVVEYGWGIVEFSKISLTLSIANIGMVAMNAASVVLFPILKRMSNKELNKIYNDLNVFVFIICSIVLAFYYPLKELLFIWLPRYQESFFYLSIIAPIFFFESELVLILNNYMKTLRLERLILKVTIVSVCFITLILFLILHLNLEIQYVLVSLIFVDILKVISIKKILLNNGILYDKNIFLLEIIVTGIFIWYNVIIGGEAGCLIYLISCLSLLFYKMKDIKAMIAHLSK